MNALYLFNIPLPNYPHDTRIIAIILPDIAIIFFVPNRSLKTTPDIKADAIRQPPLTHGKKTTPESTPDR